MRLLLTGDSIIARLEGKAIPHINYNLKRLLPNLTVVNTAIPGINSQNLLDNLDSLVLNRTKANYVVILIGANDLARHKQVKIAQYRQNLKQICQKLLQEYASSEIIMITPPAVDETKQRFRDNQLIGEYSQVVKEVASEYQLVFIDLYQRMLEQPGKEIYRGLLDDGLHFGDLGYNLLAQLIADQVKELGE